MFKKICFIFLVFMISATCFAKESEIASDLVKENVIEKLKNDVLVSSQAIQEIRRDQLNYKLEKDLLKEVYSTNLQTVNSLIAISLAVITIIGFLGVRNIREIKEKFNGELLELKELKNSYKLKFDVIDAYVVEIKNKINSVESINTDQSKRLRILEIQEKVTSLFSLKNLDKALEYADIGLIDDENNIIFLHYKALILIRFKRYDEAKIYLMKLISIDGDQVANIFNMLELLLLSRNVDEYDRFLKKYFVLIENFDAPIWYLELLKKYLTGTILELCNHIKNFDIGETGNNYLKTAGWIFDDPRIAFKSDAESDKKKLLYNVLNFLDAKDTKENLLLNIEKLNTTS